MNMSLEQNAADVARSEKCLADAPDGGIGGSASASPEHPSVRASPAKEAEDSESVFSACENGGKANLPAAGKSGVGEGGSARENEYGDESFVSGDDADALLSEGENSGGLFVSENDAGSELPLSEKESEGETSAFEERSGDAPLHSLFLREDADGPKPARFLGVRLRKAGQVFFFPDNQLPVRVGSKVIVAFEQGSLFGEVDSIFFGDTSAAGETASQPPPGRVIAPATAQDIALHAENRILADEATAFCITCIRQYSLDMKLVDVEVLHDRSKIVFYFTAPARIDFRDLVKDLVRNYRTRIELRQIGVRHETQMIGGIGNCGMVCCCHQYLRKFAPVTIKMAKEQNLFLNPAKLSGMCGRLLCCLSFEQSNYEEFNRRCPKLGKKYATSAGTFKIIRANMFTRNIIVSSDAREESEFTLDAWEALAPRRLDARPSEIQRATHSRRAAYGEAAKGRFGGKGRQHAGEHAESRPDDFPHADSAEDADDFPAVWEHRDNSMESFDFDENADGYGEDVSANGDSGLPPGDGSNAPEKAPPLPEDDIVP
ncbi:MAG: hypothetical protein LBD42_05315 [Desulfovibrio sp.]|nr:hypothetical protein [Desulfovibrio sp.]